MDAAERIEFRDFDRQLPERDGIIVVALQAPTLASMLRHMANK